MNPPPRNHAGRQAGRQAPKLLLAITGAGALLIYVLACTSFSPDDKKVLYTTFDPQSGLIGMAVYDRPSGKSELLFLPFTHETPELAPEVVFPLQAQWLPDGRSILVAWSKERREGTTEHETDLHLALLPLDRRGPVRFFQFCAEEAAFPQGMPLPLAGSALYLRGKSNTLVRLELTTGQIHRQNGVAELFLLPAPTGNRLFYLGALTNQDGTTDGEMEVGSLNLKTFARKQILTFTPENCKDQTELFYAFALSPNGKR